MGRAQQSRGNRVSRDVLFRQRLFGFRQQQQCFRRIDLKGCARYAQQKTRAVVGQRAGQLLLRRLNVRELQGKQVHVRAHRQCRARE